MGNHLIFIRYIFPISFVLFCFFLENTMQSEKDDLTKTIFPLTNPNIQKFHSRAINTTIFFFGFTTTQQSKLVYPYLKGFTSDFIKSNLAVKLINFHYVSQSYHVILANMKPNSPAKQLELLV